MSFVRMPQGTAHHAAAPPRGASSQLEAYTVVDGSSTHNNNMNMPRTSALLDSTNAVDTSFTGVNHHGGQSSVVGRDTEVTKPNAAFRPAPPAATNNSNSGASLQGATFATVSSRPAWSDNSSQRGDTEQSEALQPLPSAGATEDTGLNQQQQQTFVNTQNQNAIPVTHHHGAFSHTSAFPQNNNLQPPYSNQQQPQPLPAACAPPDVAAGAPTVIVTQPGTTPTFRSLEKESSETAPSEQRPLKRPIEVLYEAKNGSASRPDDDGGIMEAAPKKAATPKQLRLTAVEVADKVFLPSDLFDKTGKDQNADGMTVYAKLGQKFKDDGGDEQIYEEWRNPDFSSSWHMPMPNPRDSPIVVPDTLSHTQIIGRDSSGSLSLVSDLDFDSRFYGISEQGGRIGLKKQSQKTLLNLGHIDRARHRDYRVIPVDYYLANYEEEVEELFGGRSKAAAAAALQSSSIGGGGRRRQRPREPMSPAQRRFETRSSKASKPSEASVRVGRTYQATVPLCPMPGGYERDGLVPDCTRIWDPQLADAAEKRGEDIDGFLSQAMDLTSKTILMEALHRSHYSVENATAEFVTLYRQAKEPSTLLTSDGMWRADKLFKNSRKDFWDVAKSLGRNLSTVLVQYYRWKATNEEGCYSKLKEDLREADDSDWCAVCDDGGQLIVCDRCHKAYHFTCLDPPLEEAPEGDWFCNECMKSSAMVEGVVAETLANNAGNTHESQVTSQAEKPLALRESINEAKEDMGHLDLSRASGDSSNHDVTAAQNEPRAVDKGDIIDLTS